MLERGRTIDRISLAIRRGVRAFLDSLKKS